MDKQTFTQAPDGLEFYIDKLTNSIESVELGHSFPTEVAPLARGDLKRVATGWNFAWNKESKIANRTVYKLTTITHPEIIHGLVSLEVKPDHVFMHLLESAPFNVGKNKQFLGVVANLVAFGCRLSYSKGLGGVLAFDAKTALIAHYEKTLGALRIGSSLRMVIDEQAADTLITQYYSIRNN